MARDRRRRTRSKTAACWHHGVEPTVEVYGISHEVRAVLEGHLVEFRQQHPDEQPVGLILEAGTDPYDLFRTTLEEVGCSGLEGDRLVAVYPPVVALQLLRAYEPAAVPYFRAVPRGERHLPLVVVTADGMIAVGSTVLG